MLGCRGDACKIFRHHDENFWKSGRFGCPGRPIPTNRDNFTHNRAWFPAKTGYYFRIVMNAIRDQIQIPPACGPLPTPRLLSNA